MFFKGRIMKIKDVFNDILNEGIKIKHKPKKMTIFYNLMKSDEPNKRITGSLDIDSSGSRFNIFYLIKLAVQNILNKAPIIQENYVNKLHKELINEQEVDDLTQQQPQDVNQQDLNNIEQSTQQQQEQPESKPSPKLISALEKLDKIIGNKEYDTFILSVSKEGERGKSDPDIKGQVGIWLSLVDEKQIFHLIMNGKKMPQKSEFTNDTAEDINEKIQQYMFLG
jgi:hypothetical protein